MKNGIDEIIKNANDVIDEYIDNGETKELIEAVRIGFRAVINALRNKNNE
jgi:hypothetical protein